jgi:hypothetical protein
MADWLVLYCQPSRIARSRNRPEMYEILSWQECLMKLRHNEYCPIHGDRPCSFMSLIFGTWRISFHSSALWSILLNVRNAQLAFEDEPENLRVSTVSVVIWSIAYPGWWSSSRVASRRGSRFLSCLPVGPPPTSPGSAGKTRAAQEPFWEAGLYLPPLGRVSDWPTLRP